MMDIYNKLIHELFLPWMWNWIVKALLESWLCKNVMYDYKSVKTFGFKFEKKVETCQNK